MEQKLIQETLAEMNDDKVRAFKQSIRNVITNISNDQNELLRISKRIEEQKAILKSMKLEQLDAQTVL
jgi:hypothetical protein